MNDDALIADLLAIVSSVLLTRRLPPAQLGAIVACLRDNGAGALATVLIGEIPFSDEGRVSLPSAEVLDRLTHE